jgi:phosphate transport system substrate-binding protein
MKKSVFVLIVSVFIFVGMSSFSSAQDKIIAAETGDTQELFQVLSSAFERANPGKRLEILPSIDSSGGIRATARGRCDLWRAARLEIF